MISGESDISVIHEASRSSGKPMDGYRVLEFL